MGLVTSERSPLIQLQPQASAMACVLPVPLRPTCGLCHTLALPGHAIPLSPLLSYKFSYKMLLNLSKPLFSHLQNGENSHLPLTVVMVKRHPVNESPLQTASVLRLPAPTPIQHMIAGTLLSA